MQEKILDELFESITEVTGIKDIGYHKIKDGKLNPVYKTNTEFLDVERWRKTHENNPVYIKDTPVLLDIISSKKPITINDTKNDSRSDDAFFLFGVDSITIVPVINMGEVHDIICIVSIGKIHYFQDDEVNKSVELVEQFTGKLLNNN